jgi:redox-sensing transcriptional repressor
MTAARTGLSAVGVTADRRSIPEATVARLAVYLRALTVLGERGVATVSSEELASAAGVNSATLRKDLSFLGSYGVRGVGYDVELLIETVQQTLGLHQNRAVALIGIGHLGQALVGYAGFASRGFRIAALIDADPEVVGTTLQDLRVQHIDQLDDVVSREQIAIAVIAVPAAAAQSVCDRLVEAGVTSILNFAPTHVSVPNHVHVRKVDLAAELQILSFHDNRRAASGADDLTVPDDASDVLAGELAKSGGVA